MAQNMTTYVLSFFDWLQPVEYNEHDLLLTVVILIPQQSIVYMYNKYVPNANIGLLVIAVIIHSLTH